MTTGHGARLAAIALAALAALAPVSTAARPLDLVDQSLQRGDQTAAVYRTGRGQPAPVTPAPVVFICQKGAAKSLIAAAYFNKMAAERGLRERAAFRALTPQEAVSASVVDDLKADGVAIPDGMPTAIGRADITGATHVFALGCELPSAAAGKGVTWTDIPSDRGYGPMRDAIVSRVSALLDQIQGRAR